MNEMPAWKKFAMDLHSGNSEFLRKRKNKGGRPRKKPPLAAVLYVFDEDEVMRMALREVNKKARE